MTHPVLAGKDPGGENCDPIRPDPLQRKGFQRFNVLLPMP